MNGSTTEVSQKFNDAGVWDSSLHIGTRANDHLADIGISDPNGYPMFLKIDASQAAAVIAQLARWISDRAMQLADQHE